VFFFHRPIGLQTFLSGTEFRDPFYLTSQIGNICPSWRVLVPNRNRLYIDCVLPHGAQPAQLTNAQLRARRSRDRPYLRPGVLVYKRPEVVRRTYQADCRCARTLLLR
jgi:hypothetical protein